MRLILFLCSATLCFFAFTNAACADWQNTPIPGGTITSFTSDATYIYVSTDTGGVFRSADHGSTWEASNAGLPDKSVAAVRASNGVLYAAMKNGFGGAIFFSMDHGTTWTAPASPYFGFVFCLEPTGTSMLAGTWYGVAKSTNSGDSWPTMPDNGLPSNAGVTALAVKGSAIFAGVSASSVGGTGVFRTTNNGGTWTTRNTGLANTIINALALTPTEVFAGTPTGLSRSLDDGAHWTAVSGSLGEDPINSLMSVGSTVLAGTTTGIFASSTTDDSWTDIRGNIPEGTSVTAIGIADNQLLVGTANGVYSRPLHEVAGVSQAHATNDFQFWPNPSRGSVTITNTSGISRVTMTDLSGKEMAINVDRVTAATLKIRLQHYTAGIYLIKLFDGVSSVRTERIIFE
jgi:hypothetical protein